MQEGEAAPAQRPPADGGGALQLVGGPGGPPLVRTAEQLMPHGESVQPPGRAAPAHASARPAAASAGLSDALGAPPRETAEAEDAPARDKKSRTVLRREARQRQRIAGKAAQQEAARQPETRLDHKNTGSSPAAAAEAAQTPELLNEPRISQRASADALRATASLPEFSRTLDPLIDTGLAALVGEWSGHNKDVDKLYLAHVMAQLMDGNNPAAAFQVALQWLAPKSESELDGFFLQILNKPPMYEKTAATMEVGALSQARADARERATTQDAKSRGRSGMYERCILSIDRVARTIGMGGARLGRFMPDLSLVLQAARNIDERRR